MIELKKIGRWYQFKNLLDTRLEKVIDKKLSYVKAGSNFLPNPIWGLVKLYNARKRAFPAGLLSLVEPILESWCKQYNNQWCVDRGASIRQSEAMLNTLRPYQIEAFQSFWLSEGGLISLPTSAGKTRIAERILASFPLDNILVVCPTKELCGQWEDELGVMVKDKKIRIATYQKLYRELVKDKEFLKKYNFVVWDECHHVSANTLYKIGMNCPNAMMLGLTATEKRMDGAEMKIQAVLGDIIYKVPIQQLVQEGYIVQGQVVVIDIPKYKARPDEDYKDIYRNAIVLNEHRNNKIRDIALVEKKYGTVIIICKQLEQGQIIYDSLKKYCKVIYVNGNSEDREKTFEDIVGGKYEVVVATKIYGEGVSIPRLRTMILASGGKSSTEIIQTTGRMLRLFEGKDKAIIYDFRDLGRSLGQHYKERLKIYVENGFEVVSYI